ncbi:MAG: KH domain-containing protein [Candidatus Sumerlaeales bacterium]|nr:KH domain-containing protein [Candidatus Sumerlaeales bacterium]
MNEVLSEGNQLQKLILYIAQALVDQPENVSVNLVEGESSIILELKVAPDDIGKIIGKGGQTAKSMRKVLSAAATKLKKKALLQIVE